MDICMLQQFLESNAHGEKDDKLDSTWYSLVPLVVPWNVPQIALQAVHIMHTTSLTSHLMIAFNVYVHFPSKLPVHVQSQNSKHDCEYKQNWCLDKIEQMLWRIPFDTQRDLWESVIMAYPLWNIPINSKFLKYIIYQDEYETTKSTLTQYTPEQCCFIVAF